MKTIAVIFGGQSTEHDVSVVTALASVIKPLKLSKKFEVLPIYIAKDGSWYWDKRLDDISLFQSGEIENVIRKLSKLHLLFDNGLTIVKSSQFAGRKQYRKIDIVFPAIHGTKGEDGSLMGILEMANVPYVGCGVAASSIAMDKVFAKQITSNAGLPTTPWVWFYASDLAQNPQAIIKKCNELKYPLFVKPAHLGSSIGISKVEKSEQLMNALEVAAHYDEKIIVEQAVENLVEVTLPIIGNEEPVPALLEQPLLSADDFFDFDTKYMQGGKKGGKKGAQGYSNLPAKLPKDQYQRAEALGIAVYKILGCSGIARIDILIDSKADKVYFNEVNPMPGSLYAHNWRAAGLSSVDLVIKLVEYAEQRFQNDQQKVKIFTTNYLKQF